MSERPIIFSAPMVQALLAGRKTQTRRLASSPLRRVRPGDRLWVRETVRADEDAETFEPMLCWEADKACLHLPSDDAVWMERHYLLRCYRSTDPDLDAYKPVPAIHMPRWASRLTLHVEAVRVQRLQDISGTDALAEGITPEEGVAPWRVFLRLWNSLHGEGAWQSNPEVVALTFTVERRNIDA